MKTIEKQKITDLFDFLLEEYQLFAPVSKDVSTVNFEEIEHSEQITLDFYNSNEPPKKLFFPQLEVLYSYSKDGSQTVPQLKPQKQRILFGLRPCDAKSLSILDKVFDSGDYNDPYYVEKRKNTINFVFACNEPQTSCFCKSVGIGPFSKDSADVFIIDLGDKYLFEPITPAGQLIVEKMPGLDAETKDITASKQLASQADAKIIKECDLNNFSDQLAKKFEDPVWDQIHQKCIGCGICTFLCPTCHCFDVIDDSSGKDGKRIRIWDSCIYSTFTLEASSHNPRQTSKQRMRQRIMHKFAYFVENYGECACVGCGRCLRSCPVKMDITKAIKAVKNSK